MSSLKEDCSEYAVARLYTGPRPAYVPKAEPIHLSLDVVSNTYQNFASPSSSGSSSSFFSVVADPFPSPSQIEASRDSMYTARADLHVTKARITSLDMLSPCRQESAYLEHEDFTMTPCSELSGLRSLSCSSSSSSSTNSLSEELRDQTLLDPPCSPNVNEGEKGECFLCNKVKRLQKKETCLVCCARYCGSCVLEAMGSMPEGRKCVLCIGKPICELQRQHLGKPTSLLKHLLNPLEVQQIMKAEKECSVNQLLPNQICVNGQPLTGKEFAQLLGCRNPPPELKAGRYWYDPQCGFWGKEGEKPKNIISAHLKVGGDLREDASAGSTGVFINSREITEVEVKMLKIADVLCSPQTRLVLHPDGTFQEEGQNHCPGKLWNKGKVKIFCSLFSLPTPKFHGVAASEPSRVVPAYLDSMTTHKILLLGHSGCGASTIIKQAKILYGKDFTSKERQDIKALIQRNIYKYIVILLDACKSFENGENEERRKVIENTPSTSKSAGVITELGKNVYTVTAMLRKQADWFLQTDARGERENYLHTVIREHASLLEELWKSEAIQATYKRKAEIPTLPDVAGYFLNRVAEILAHDYCPSDLDILCAEGGTQDCLITEIEFRMDEDGVASEACSEDYGGPLAEARYHLIQTGSVATAESLNLFDEVQALVYCIALDSYDQMWSDKSCPLQNKMLISRSTLESILTRYNFRGKPILVFFNKFDLFQEKLLHVPLTACEWFSAYNPVEGSTQDPKAMASQAYTYIAYMFKEHFETINPNGGGLYTFPLEALKQSSVEDGFHYLKEILGCWEGKESTGSMYYR